jgi:hypothetical protein
MDGWMDGWWVDKKTLFFLLTNMSLPKDVIANNYWALV